MELLAKVAAGRYMPDGREDEASLRQLGYACELARGRVEDPDGNLGRAARFCRERLEGTAAPAGRFRDPVQASWGAPWYVDARKLRTELPLHLMKLRRETGSVEAKTA
ncbi:MAG: hypothetical protein OXN81_00190 [Alphaproteobacteria bacterium]|nr:hypothetical protein [Alphaproteobacteria bacterium]